MVHVKVDNFGMKTDLMTHQPTQVRRVTLTNDHQMTVQLLTLGATIASVQLPDKHGVINDLALGFDDVQGYIDAQPAYIGGTVGRVAGRVAKGRFKLNGKVIEVTKNVEDKYQLHGGFIGFDSVIWDIEKTLADGVVFKHVSPDGHEGYPGEVTCRITCTLNNVNEFRMQFEATTKKTTCVNVTNHAYFNLAGHSSGKEGLLQHSVMINADFVVDTDNELIPTGKLRSVDCSFFDLRSPIRMSERLPLFKGRVIKGYDNCFCVNLDGDKTTRVARVHHCKSGRWLEIYTNQPGLYFYTSNNLPDADSPIIGKGGAKYVKYGGFCLETEKYPNAMNHPTFPSIFLKPGKKYYHDVVYKFGH